MTKILINASGKPYISSQGKALIYNEGSFIVVTTNAKLATMTCNSQSYTLTGDELSHAFYVIGAGTYTITVSKDGKTSSDTVTVTTPNIYEIRVNVQVLPAEFQEVEYIETTGTQYLNTGIVPTVNTNVKLKAQYTGIIAGANEWNTVAGCAGGDANERFYPMGYIPTSGYIRQTYGSAQFTQPYDTNIHIVDFNT